MDSQRMKLDYDDGNAFSAWGCPEPDNLQALVPFPGLDGPVQESSPNEDQWQFGPEAMDTREAFEVEGSLDVADEQVSLQDPDRKPEAIYIRRCWFRYIWMFAKDHTAETVWETYQTKLISYLGQAGAPRLLPALNEPYTREQFVNSLELFDAEAKREDLCKKIRVFAKQHGAMYARNLYLGDALEQLGEADTETLFRALNDEEGHVTDIHREAEHEKEKQRVRNYAATFGLLSVEDVRSTHFDHLVQVLGDMEAIWFLVDLKDEEDQRLRAERLRVQQVSAAETQLQYLLEAMEEEWAENDGTIGQKKFVTQLTAMIGLDAEFSAQLREYLLHHVREFARTEGWREAFMRYDEPIGLIYKTDMGSSADELWDELKELEDRTKQAATAELQLQNLLKAMEKSSGGNDRSAESKFSTQLTEMIELHAAFSAQLRECLICHVREFAQTKGVWEAFMLYAEQVDLIYKSNGSGADELWDELQLLEDRANQGE